METQSVENISAIKILHKNFTNKKARGKAKEYSKIMQFSDFETAAYAMKTHVAGQMWIRKYVRKCKDGDKVYYACKSNPNCPKTLYIQRKSNSNDASIWLCSSSNHQHKVANKGPLPADTVDLVKKLLKNGIVKIGNLILTFNDFRFSIDALILFENASSDYTAK
jgi:hypothetical protein